MKTDYSRAECNQKNNELNRIVFGALLPLEKSGQKIARGPPHFCSKKFFFLSELVAFFALSNAFWRSFVVVAVVFSSLRAAAVSWCCCVRGARRNEEV
jgi:hypothetical protein